MWMSAQSMTKSCAKALWTQVWNQYGLHCSAVRKGRGEIFMVVWFLFGKRQRFRITSTNPWLYLLFYVCRVMSELFLY